MTIGTGIAIAGLWVYAGLVAHSSTTTTSGVWLSMVLAAGGTVWFSL